MSNGGEARPDLRGHGVPGLGGAWAAGIILLVITLLSAFTVTRPGDEEPVAVVGGLPLDDGVAGQTINPEAEGFVDEGGPEVVTRLQEGTAGSAGSEGTTDAQGSAGPGTAAAGQYDCSKGQNAGDSDVGVNPKSIKFGATVVKTGPATSFLSEAQFGIEAVRQKVNRAGGICGRLIEVVYEDDGWDPSTGQRIISKWIGEKQVFGLVVNPSSEGLRGAINGGVIGQNKVPVVGADGMLIGQYHEPWVWPIATSTHSIMHVMIKDALARASEAGISKPTFAIVYESNYRFGVEGFHTFSKTLDELGLKHVDQKIQGATSGGSAPSYGTQASDFVGSCKDASADPGKREWAKCDLVVVLLEPATAAQWVKDNGLGTGTDGRPELGFGAAQPLFVNSFVRDCGAPCTGLRVWTSFKPPIAPFDSDPAVAEYLNDLRAVSTSADASNPHVQGAYVGMSLLVEALEQLGPAPTREDIQKVLDSMTFDSKLAPPMTFKSGNHFAAVNAQAFEAIFNVNSFVGWRYTNSGFVSDDQPEKHQLRE